MTTQIEAGADSAVSTRTAPAAGIGTVAEPALPPGPTESPVLQVLRWIFSPVALLEKCHRLYGDAFTMRSPGNPPMVFVSDPQVVKQVFTADPERLHAGEANYFLKPFVGEHSMLLLDGVRHRQHRKLMMPSFHGERMQAYGETISAIARREIASLPVGEPLPIHPRMQELTLDVIIRTVMGLDEGAEYDRLRALFKTLLTNSTKPIFMVFLQQSGEVRWKSFQEKLGRFSPLGWYRSQADPIDAILYRAIRERREKGAGGRQDILTMLVEAKDETGATLSDEEIHDELVTMLLAGHETTATAISFVIQRLTEHPEVEARLRAELARLSEDGVIAPARAASCEYLDAVIRETMRLSPVVPIVARMLKEPMRFGPHFLPAGSMVCPVIYLTQRRADVYPDPERFSPERFLTDKGSPYSFYAFGGGTRRCIGMALALYEAKIVLAELITATKFRAPDGYRSRIVRRGVTFAPAEGMPIVVEKLLQRGKN